MVGEQAMVAIMVYQGEGKRGLESFHDSLGHATQHKCWSKMRKKITVADGRSR